MPSTSAAIDIQHPDNLLNTGSLPAHLEARLHSDGIRFATKLQTSNGHTFLLCGPRCPQEAGAEMLKDALRIRQVSQPLTRDTNGHLAQHPARQEVSYVFNTQEAEPVSSN